MKVKELIADLQAADPELDIVIFAVGKLYTPLETQIWEVDDEGKVKEFEISCGWAERDEPESDE
jgi:hypothetical protein